MGTPLRLQALVETLCSEMAEAFVSQGLTLPPWRRFHALLSKWFDPEEMPAAPPPPPAPAPPLLPPAAQLPLPAATCAALAPLHTVQPQAGVPAGVALQVQQPVPAAARPAPSLLQQQAAAALAERQTSNGGSQDFYEALEMHKESMRLQQQAAAGAPQWQSPTRPPLPPSHPQEQQQHAQPEQQQPQQQGVAPAALSRENLRQLDAAYSSRGAAPSGGAAGAGGGASRHPGERSSKPRRRRAPPAGLALASGSHHAIQAALWDEEEGGLGVAPPALGGLSGAHIAQAQLQLHGSGSWSELSTILEGRSNASSPAAAVLLAAGNAPQLGTSCASRRSAGSAFAAAALASASAGTAAALPPPQRSPARGDQQHAAPSAAGVEAAARQMAAAPPHPSPGASLVGFAAPPLGRASLAKSLAKSSAAASSAQPPSTASSGSGSSPLAPVGVALPHAAAGGGAYEAGAAALEGSGRGRRKVVSLLAKGLKSVGQKQTWAGLLPGVNTGERQAQRCGLLLASCSWDKRCSSLTCAPVRVTFCCRRRRRCLWEAWLAATCDRCHRPHPPPPTRPPKPLPRSAPGRPQRPRPAAAQLVMARRF